MYKKIFYGLSSPYDAIITSCLKSDRIMEGKDISCIAFLDDIEYLDNTEKFSISVLTSDFKLKTYEIHQDNNLLKWDERLYRNSGKSYPIYLDFVFSKNNFLKRDLNSIEISLIEGEKYEDVREILKENAIEIPGVYNKKAELVTEKGYLIGRDIWISEGKYLKSVSIFSANVYAISYDNGEFIIDLKVVLYGNEYDTQFKVNKIAHSSFSGGEEFVVTNESDLRDYKEDILGNVSIVSIFDGISSKPSADEITNYCSEINEYETGLILCDYLNNIKVGVLAEDGIENYIDLQISESTDNSIDLSKLLPINFIERDDEI